MPKHRRITLVLARELYNEFAHLVIDRGSNLKARLTELIEKDVKNHGKKKSK